MTTIYNNYYYIVNAIVVTIISAIVTFKVTTFIGEYTVLNLFIRGIICCILPSDNNLEEIVKYLQKLEKERRKSKPGDVKIPKLKKVSISDSYKITPLGRQYLAMIEV